LHDVVEPGRLVGGSGAAGAEGADEDLGNDRADLAGGSGDTVGCRAVAGWEAWVGLSVLVHNVIGQCSDEICLHSPGTMKVVELGPKLKKN
jgi:hypothetical protein